MEDKIVRFGPRGRRLRLRLRLRVRRLIAFLVSLLLAIWPSRPAKCHDPESGATRITRCVQLA